MNLVCRSALVLVSVNIVGTHILLKSTWLVSSKLAGGDILGRHARTRIWYGSYPLHSGYAPERPLFGFGYFLWESFFGGHCEEVTTVAMVSRWSRGLE